MEDNSNPPRRGVLPLNPTQEAGGRVLYGGGGFQRIEETSHSPWIAIAVFYNTGGRYDAGARGEGATASNQGQQLIMGGG